MHRVLPSLALICLLAACAPPAPTPTRAPEQTIIPASTPAPSPVLEPTVEEIDPTNTPGPTPSPEPIGDCPASFDALTLN